MSLEFNLISSENYCTYITDGTHGTHSNQETGKYLLSAKDILDGNVHIKDNSRIISEDDFNKIHKNYKLENYDVLLTVAGTIGRTAIIKNYQNNYTFQRSVAIFKTNDKIKSLWLYYYLNSPIGKQIIKSLSKGTTQLILPLKDLRSLKIPVPKNISDQKKILSILTDIDKKIEINKRINKNLDELCHLIFKYFFIDFIPFQNNEFTDTEIGEIPKGWNITTVGDILDCKLGGTPSRSNEDYWGGDIAWINSGKVNEFRILDASEYITELGLKKSATKLLPAKTTVIAITGATLGQISLLEIDSCANQSVIGVIPNNKYPYEFVYPLISSILFELLKHQTGGAQQHINKNNVESFTIVCPPEDIISEYKNIVSSLYSQISKNCFEIENLTKLRDTLLPKLMSGEIDVSKINYDLE